MAALPEPRGDLSALVIGRLGPALRQGPPHLPAGPDDPLADEDLQLALYVCYELHYRGFDGVDPEWEWEPSLLRLRRRLPRRLGGPPAGARLRGRAAGDSRAAGGRARCRRFRPGAARDRRRGRRAIAVALHHGA